MCSSCESVPNPVLSRIALQGYRGWVVREYANGMWDAVHPSGAISPGFTSFYEAACYARDETTRSVAR
jgi:hypothetical protein